MENNRDVLVSIMLNGETISVGKLWCYYRKDAGMSNLRFARTQRKKK